MSGKKRIIKASVLSCIIFVILISGCTILNPEIENTPVATPTLAAETTGIATQSTQSENAEPVFSWSDIYPDYDEQTKSRLIEEAKDEIVRIYPDVDRSTLDGFWMDHDPAEYGPPRIIFDNVDDTSEKYMELQKLRSRGIEANIRHNIVRIKVDPESGNIVRYGSRGHSGPSDEEERIVSFGECEDKCLEFVRKVKGDDFVDKMENNYSTYKVNFDKNLKNGLVLVVPCNTYEEVRYLNDKIDMEYDLVLDRVVRYWDNLKDPELMAELTTLSSVPTISERKAKRILEEKLNETYPDEDLQIHYHNVDFEKGVLWYDDEDLVYSRQPEPIRLTWQLIFNDKEMRKIDSQYISEAFIDAHTGEIISLGFRDFRIPRGEKVNPTNFFANSEEMYE